MSFRRTLPLEHRPNRDGSTIEARHVPAPLAIEFAAEAWALAVHECSAGEMSAMNFMAANITADFSRELLTGVADATVLVRRIGTSSVQLDVLVEQEGVHAARVSHTIVRVVGGKSYPLSESEKTSLERLRERATGIEPA